jgi:hypothetical protein
MWPYRLRQLPPSGGAPPLRPPVMERVDDHRSELLMLRREIAGLQRRQDKNPSEDIALLLDAFGTDMRTAVISDIERMLEEYLLEEYKQDEEETPVPWWRRLFSL